MSFMDVFATGVPSLSCERSAHQGEQLARFFVVFGRGHEADVHAPDLVDLVVVNFRENELFLQAHIVIAPPVEGIGVDPPEIAHTGERHIEQAVEELVHPLPPQRHLRADVHPLAELEVRDGFLGLADDGALAGDSGEVADDGVDDLRVVPGLAAAHVDDDFIEFRDLHDALVAELFHQRRSDVVLVIVL